jgi:sec-independent protein translocase protein TatA
MTLGILLIFGLGTTELLLIALVVLLLFGGRKIPELMKGLGKGVKSFKDGMEGMEEELKKPSENTPPVDQTEKKD